jgi:hypothetical protein
MNQLLGELAREREARQLAKAAAAAAATTSTSTSTTSNNASQQRARSEAATPVRGISVVTPPRTQQRANISNNNTRKRMYHEIETINIDDEDYVPPEAIELVADDLDDVLYTQPRTTTTTTTNRKYNDSNSTTSTVTSTTTAAQHTSSSPVINIDDYTFDVDDDAFAIALVDDDDGVLSSYTRQQQSPTISTCDLINPTPDIHELFLHFNRKYFEDKLVSVEVKWSTRMTLYVSPTADMTGDYC